MKQVPLDAGSVVLTLAQARALIRRAIDKAEELAQTGSFVVVNEGGIVISASRMDGAGSIGIGISRAKAYEAAANHETSAQFAERMYSRPPGVYTSYQEILRDKPFPGPGAVPIREGGFVVGAISTGAELGPFLKFDGVPPDKFVVHGLPANAEDLIISYAMGLDAYAPQHGDDVARWRDAYGTLPDSFPEGHGFDEAPPARRQRRLDAAIALVESAFARARRRGASISAVVADRNGDLIQQDRMDGAAPMTPDLAEAKAATAVNFRCPSAAVRNWARESPQLATLVRFPFLPLPGGIPIFRGDEIVGAIGVAGCKTPKGDEEIASAALADHSL